MSRRSRSSGSSPERSTQANAAPPTLANPVRCQPVLSSTPASRRHHVGIWAKVGVRARQESARVQERSWRRRPESNRRWRFCSRHPAVRSGSHPVAIVLHDPRFHAVSMLSGAQPYCAVARRLVGNWSATSAADTASFLAARTRGCTQLPCRNRGAVRYVARGPQQRPVAARPTRRPEP